MSICHDLDAITDVALSYAKEHQINYNVILHNPDENGNFSRSSGSTYEFVTDSYFEKERPNVIKLFTTNSILKKYMSKKIAIADGGISPREMTLNVAIAKMSDSQTIYMPKHMEQSLSNIDPPLNELFWLHKPKKAGIDTALLQSLERERGINIRTGATIHHVIPTTFTGRPKENNIGIKIGGYNSNHRKQKKNK